MKSMFLPQVVAVELTVGPHSWHARLSEDLAGLLQPDMPTRQWLTEQLAAEAELAEHPRFRALFDLGGAILAAAVDVEARTVALGSPRFAHERFLAAVGQTASAQALRELVDAYDRASAHDAPTDIAKLARELGMVDVWRAAHQGRGVLVEAVADTAALARQLEQAMRDHQPSLRERFSQWGLDLTTQIAVLRVHLLRFVAALPALDHDHQGSEVVRLLRETLRRMQGDDAGLRGGAREHEAMPNWLRAAVAAAGQALQWLPVRAAARWIRAGVTAMARTFIAGEDMPRAAKALQQLRLTGRDATVDQLGELVVCEAEADTYRDRVLGLIAGCAAHPGMQGRNAAGIPRGHVSIKTSALCSDYNPDDPDGVWLRVGPRLRQILLAAQSAGVFIHFDAEHYPVRDLTFAMMRRALQETPQLHRWADVGIVVQAYLRDAGRHLQEVMAFARSRGVPMPIRLVKGAYWDAETIEAGAHDVLAPQFLNKAETDAAYQLLTLAALQAGDCMQLCLGSHNLRDHCFAEAARRQFYPQAPAIEHQALHMTYEALSTGMARLGWAVRNYIPVGSLLVGMAYLVRRILENSSQVGVLTAARHGVDLPALLKTPLELLRGVAAPAGHLTQGHAAPEPLRAPANSVASSPPAVFIPAGSKNRLGGEPNRTPLLDHLHSEGDDFRNVAPAMLDRPQHRAWVERELAAFRAVDGAGAGNSGAVAAGLSPSDQTFSAGAIRLCTAQDVAVAVRQAEAAAQAWAQAGAQVRAACLVRAGERMRADRPAWAALVMHEAGKARAEALADVDEAIDFLHYYARQAVAHEQRAADFGPLGVVAVVAPWNFPLAIPCGMAAAALAAGNAVLLKSAEQTPLVAEKLCDLLHLCGVPQSALRHLPGNGPDVGAPLVRDERVAAAVFTGSQQVGCLLHRTVGARVAGEHAARVVAEMGGKNAIVVTANADLDEATAGCLRSAFGHAGQKCSACSRILVDARIAGAFAERFCNAARDLQLGLATEPGTRINPVVSAEDQARLQKAALEVADEVARMGGKVLLDRSRETAGPLPGKTLPEAHGDGPRALLVGPVVALLPASAALEPDSFANRELFGPVVHIIAVDNLARAVQLWQAPMYALTGGVFAQSHDDIDWLAAQARVGNLYVNRPITGARVAIEPFGGFAMSGTGPKAGGADYLPALTHGPVERARMDADAQEVLAGAAQVRTGATLVRDAVPAQPLLGDELPMRAARMQHALATARWCRDEPLRRTLAAICQAAQAEPGFGSDGEPNRKIPGQTSHNRWFAAKGPLCVVSGTARPTAHALAHAVAAACAGGQVEVLACSAGAAAAWAQVAGTLGESVQVSEVADAFALCDNLTRAAFASVAIDGAADQYAAVLPFALGQSASDRHLRQLLAPGLWPPVREAAAVLKCHLQVKTCVVNTMRHGAELEV